jgi:hypothetical protein
LLAEGLPHLIKGFELRGVTGLYPDSFAVSPACAVGQREVNGAGK